MFSLFLRPTQFADEVNSSNEILFEFFDFFDASVQSVYSYAFTRTKSRSKALEYTRAAYKQFLMNEVLRDRFTNSEKIMRIIKRMIPKKGRAGQGDTMKKRERRKLRQYLLSIYRRNQSRILLLH